jgi:hypothetical protein
MRRVPVMLLLLGLVGPAGAVDWNTSTYPEPGDKPSSVGDQMGDLREGGESWGDAIVIPALPYSDTGATCDNVDDITPPCALSYAPDVVYSFTPMGNVNICLSLCGSGYDTILAIYDQSLVSIACNDDYCGLQSQIENVPLTAGYTYYFVVDGYGNSCGSYVFNTCSPPPHLDCPTGALLEGEPDCHDDYVDTYNGGCESIGWTPICPTEANSAVMCGTSGTYLYQGINRRDTDWFTCTGTGATMSASVIAEFPVQLMFIYGTDCDNLQYEVETGGMMQPVTLSRYVDAEDEVWIRVCPSQFDGVLCGSTYVLSMDGIQCEPTPARWTSWGSVKGRWLP